MNTERKISIDRWVGLPLVFIFNGLARALGRILRLDHFIWPERTRLIVVAKFLGMGSIVQSTPMLRALKACFPNARIVFLSASSNRELVQRLGLPDCGLYVNDRTLLSLAISSARVLWRLARKRPDIYIDLEVHSAYACLMALWSLSRNRLGFYRNSAGFKKGIYTHLMYFNARRPIHLIYLQLARMTGLDIPQDSQLEPLRISDEDRRGLDEKMNALAPGALSSTRIVINPNASDLRLQRRWPAERFARLIEALAPQHCQIILIGSSAEAAYVQNLLDRVSPRARLLVVNTAGRLALGELLALLESASCVVSNDTGPMHMALALNRPTVCLFGPVSPDHYGFQGKHARILYHPVFCSPCVHETDRPPCQQNNFCMRRIEVSEVTQAVNALLESAAGQGAPPAEREKTQAAQSEPIQCADQHGLPMGRIIRASVDLVSRRPCEACSAKRFKRMFTLGPYDFQRCAACGLERIEPQPDDQALSGLYGRRYYDAWGLHEAQDSARRMKMALFGNWLAALGPLPAKSKVLDCGAATGYLMEAAAEKGLEPYGVELSDFGAQEIGRKFEAGRVFAGPFEEAAFPQVPEGGFHAVLMCDFLEHVRSPDKALRKAHKMLAPGGSILVVTPNTASLSRRFMSSKWLHFKLEHLYCFNPGNISLLLRAAGFQPVRTKPAWKTINVQYLVNQFNTYPHWLLTPLFRLGDKVLPRKLKEKTFPVLFGEMIVLAKKPYTSRHE